MSEETYEMTTKSNTNDLITDPNEVSVTAIFTEMLTRPASKIKTDRALAIAKKARVVFERTVQDLEMEIERLIAERTAMLDMSPTSAISLIVANEFDESKFTNDYLNISYELRKLAIKLDIAKKSYKTLFGDSK